MGEVDLPLVPTTGSLYAHVSDLCPVLLCCGSMVRISAKGFSSDWYIDEVTV